MTIPVTILGGFLGAGKTTAVNHLLHQSHARIGVLVNDFGAIAIDAALIQAADGDLVALSNGCVCCALGPDLAESLSRLVDRHPAPERIVVEASGVSDPWRIAQLVKLQRGVTLDAVLVLVDATSFIGHLQDRWLVDTLERQVARADLIVLTKCDLADPAQTRVAVQRIRPGVRMLAVCDGAIPDALLDLGGPVSVSRLVADAPGHGFRTWHWANAQSLDEAALRQVLTALPAAVLRVKGFCRIGAEGRPHLLHGVGTRWSLTAWAGDVPAFALVLIGTNEMPADDDLAGRFSEALLS